MRKRGLWRGSLPIACALLLLGPAKARAAPSLSHAEALYEVHDSVGAERELRALLAHELPRRLAAAAHLYLGLVELEARGDTAAAEAELGRALKLDPRVAMPFSATSEELQLYDHVLQELRTLGPPIEPGAPVPGAPPLKAPAVPAAAVAEAPPASGHGAWPWVLGVGAIAAASASVWGFLQVAAESSAAAKSHSQPVPLAQAQSALSQGQLGEGVGIAGAVVAVGLGVGAVLTW